MKSTFFFLAFFLILLTCFGCRETAEEKKEKEIEMISTQTMGLAYLELFKLEEAEESFLKYITLAPEKKMGYANLGLVYLRMGKFAEAEEQLLKGIEIDSKDADINLILATVYQMSEQRDKAIAILNRSLEFDPGHEKSLYMLSELYASNEDEASQSKRTKCLVTLVQKAPNNIVPILELTAIYIRNAETDKAIEQLEIIKKQFPEFPKEAIEYYNSALDNLRIPDTEKALTSFMIFHNYLKVTFPYQGGIKELKGSQGALVGLPLITYDLQHSSLKDEDTSILEVIKFTDATSAVGLDAVPAFPDRSKLEKQYITHVTSADYDSDGDLDIYVGSYNYEKEIYEHFLFNNDLSLFWDVSMDVGITHTGKESSAVFADYDNDGFLDLYIVKEGGNILYKNVGEGKFNDVTKEALLDSQRESTRALFVDLEHDGDLDIFETGPDSNYVYRNNGDGTFIEQAEKMGLAAPGIKSNDAAFGDFDDDGDIDLLVTNENKTNSLYSNQRQGLFKDVAPDNLPHNEKGSKLVAVADWNNDGFLDLFLQGSDNRENNGLLVNQGTGRFEWAERNQEMFKDLNNITIYDTAFFDFDNDGFLDILVVGKSKRANGRGILLYHNERDGRFTNVSQLLPEDRKAGEKIVLIDYDGDGDLDLLITGVQGGVFLLRNDGGNLDHYVNIKLVGLRTGSAKNNYFGIGAKVEMRAGDLYQTKVVNDPNVHFGLGDRTKADIIRITWTNGVPQNILLPEGDQSLIESQSLKGSCPFLYTWNGDKFVFVKDITWRSALGMPLGIMGGKAQYAFADASDDYIKIPGEMLQEKEGVYMVQMTSELWETIYMDQMQLVVVDHPDSIDVFVPEQFSPPPFPGLELFQFEQKQHPLSATDGKGADLRAFITKKDDKYIANFKPDKYQGVTEMHDLILDFGELKSPENVYLILNGWIFPTDASINVALSQSDEIQVKPPNIQVINEKGEWETVIKNLGFPMGKDKNVIADLSGKFLSNDHRVRIQTNMEIYWDEVFLAKNNPRVPVRSTTLNPMAADLHYRGFSKTYKKGGRYGPHWFDYDEVDLSTKWRDLTGNYTRYGDVLPLLTDPDNQYIISNAGDETTIKFDASKLPKLEQGWTRDFLIHSVGWVKDGDLNTAHGNSVLPLPYHGMRTYPPSDKDIYPNTPELQEYHAEYNTRTVTEEGYRKEIKQKSLQ